jgi:MFS family permease
MRPKVFYGWIVCLAALIITVSYGFFYTYSAFFDPLVAEFGWNREQIASIFSIYPLIYSISVILLGRLTDKYGPRKVVALGAIFLALGIGLCSQANSLWELRLFFGIIAPIGTGAFYVPPIYCVQRWFVKRKGLAVGIVASGVGLGTLAFAPLATYLIEVVGWRTTFVIFAIGLGILLLAAAAIIRADPTDKGLKPYGFQAGEGEEHDKPVRQVEGLTTGQALKTTSFWLLYVPYVLGFTCLTLVIVHVVPYGEDIGISRMAAAGAISLLGIFNIVGRIAMGTISDRIDRRRGLIISYALTAIAMLGFSMSKGAWMLYLSAGLLGFAYGGFVAQYAAIIGDYFGLASLGMILAIATTGYGIGGAIGPYIGGTIFESFSSYQLAFLICIVLAVLATIITIFLKPPQERTKAA